MLRISQLDVSIGSVAILRGVSLELPSGVMAGLIGRNGAGKTTLMRSVMGLLKPRAGRVEFDGADLGHIPAHRRAHAGIGYMPEDRRLIPELTVEENILAPAWAVGRHDGRGTLEEDLRHDPGTRAFRATQGLTTFWRTAEARRAGPRPDVWLEIAAAG